MTKRSGEARRFREWGALAFAGGLILGCANSAQAPSAGGDEIARGAVTARPQTSAAAQEQAKADAYSRQAALYAQMATANRAAASAAANVTATQAATADAIGTSSRASATTSLAIASSGDAVARSGDSGVVQKTLAGVAAGAATRQSDYQKAAALADRLAANAQRTGNFYQAKARELSGGAAGGGAQ